MVRPALRHVAATLVAALGATLVTVVPAGAATLTDGRSVVERAWEQRLVGAHVRPLGDDQTPERSEAAFLAREELVGRDLDISQWFHPFDRAWPTVREEVSRDAGRVPLVSWAGSDTAAILAGDHDAFLVARARAAAAFGDPILVRWFRQMDSEGVQDRAGPPERFIAAWRRIHGIFAAEGATNVEWVWCPTAFGFTAAGGERAQAYYPGDDHVDFTCADAYDSAPQRYRRSKGLVDLFGAFHAWGQTQAPPMLVAEVATLGAADRTKAAWLDDARGELAKLPAIRAWVWFDARGTADADDTTADWRIDTSDEAIAAFRRFVTDAAFAPTTGRIGGVDRIATSVALSRTAFATADAVVLARADDFADALSASSLAVANDGPLLITPPDRLDDRVLGELQRLGASRVLLVGGAAALGGGVRGSLEAAGLTVTRIAGDTRYATSARVARKVIALTGTPERVTLASGADWPDALVAADLAAIDTSPILLTLPHALVPEAAEVIRDLVAPGGGVDVVGGPAALDGTVLDAAVALRGASGRIAGENRYMTAAAVARAAIARGAPARRLLVASGEGFADALSAGVAAHRLDGLLLLTRRASAASAVGALAAQLDGPLEVVVVGGESAVSEAARRGLPSGRR